MLRSSRGTVRNSRASFARCTVAMMLLTAFLMGNARAASADEPVPVPRGSRVRVGAPDRLRAPVIGTLVAADAETLMLTGTPSGESVSLPRASVASFELSRGRPRKVLRDAGVGLLVGAGLGALLAAGAHEDNFLFSQSEEALIGGIAFGTLGGALGLVVGIFDRGSERWTEIEASRVRVVIAPHSGGALQIGVSAGF